MFVICWMLHPEVEFRAKLVDIISYPWFTRHVNINDYNYDSVLGKKSVFICFFFCLFVCFFLFFLFFFLLFFCCFFFFVCVCVCVFLWFFLLFFWGVVGGGGGGWVGVCLKKYNAFFKKIRVKSYSL